MSKQGIMIISLDFELNWGVHDLYMSKQYEENILGARKAIPRILDLFNKFNIHATWATIGMLFFARKEELIANLPTHLPNYENKNFSPYSKLESIGEDEQRDPFHFGRSLLQQIESYPNQEIGTHTFSHYYCLEKGQNRKEFESDLRAASEVARVNGHTIQSLVFPRNQMNRDYLQVCKAYGVQSFRGNEDSWVYKESSFHSEGILKRALRFSDHYLNIFGHHTYSIDKVETEPLVNLPSSRFLRPYNADFKAFESLRLRRIKKSIKNAAKNGEVYHLWWHPHNFGKDIDENIQFLTDILVFVSKLQDEYGLMSLNMGEAYAFVLESNKERLMNLTQ